MCLRAVNCVSKLMKSFLFFFSLLLLSPLAKAEELPLSLDALVADITKNNPELRFYEEEIAAAKVGRRVAGMRSDPELSVSAGRKRATDGAGQLAGEGTTWSVSVSQTFEWSGRLALRKSIANRQ